MYDKGGVLTHGRLKENIDALAGDKLGLPDPRTLKSSGPVPAGGIDIRSFVFPAGRLLGGQRLSVDPDAARRRFGRGRPSPSQTTTPCRERPRPSRRGTGITACRAPCNRDSGIGYPLANGPVEFDSGQLGYGTGTSRTVTTGSQTPIRPRALFAGKKAGKRGTTYTYFCRIHPYMRGSIRVKK